MNPDRRAALASMLITLAFAAVLFAIVVERGAYAPGARAIQQTLASTDDWTTFLNSAWFGGAVYFVVRKTYGAVAFALLGFLGAPVFARDKRVVATATVLGIVRLSIEIVERMRYGGVDSTLESVFDIVTGTCAAALGAAIRNAVARRSEKRA
jgi:hypothetical protein